jgi:hypothetical protein
MKKKFIVMTASDSKYGDFLVNEWLKSLKDNIDLSRVDIAVIDYGLNENQKDILLKNNVILVAGKRDGHVVNIRFRDMAYFLKLHKYNQILCCDSGDIIFQKSIMPLFNMHRDSFRVVFENMRSNFLGYLLEQNPFDAKLKEDLVKTLRGKKIINGGFILAPYNKFLRLCKNMNLIKNKNLYGPDQAILNATLYKEGFVNLPNEYNYVIMNNSGLRVINGIFYHNNKKITVVHNAGGLDIFRAVRNFGYGPNKNQFSRIRYILFRAFIKLGFLSIPRFFLKIKNLITRLF